MSALNRVTRELRPIVEDAIGRGGWELKVMRRRCAHPVRLVHVSGRFIRITETKVQDRRVIANLRADIARIERGS